MKEDLLSISNKKYTSVDKNILLDDHASAAERQYMYKSSRRYYFDENGERLTYRDPFPIVDSNKYATNRKRMHDFNEENIENPGQSLEEFLGECEVC